MDQEEMDARANLARFLSKEIWPADRDRVIQTARSQHAPEEVLATLGRAPDRTFTNLADLWAELGGENETERS